MNELKVCYGCFFVSLFCFARKLTKIEETIALMKNSVLGLAPVFSCFDVLLMALRKLVLRRASKKSNKRRFSA